MKYFIESQIIALNEEYKALTITQRKAGASFFNRVLRPAGEKYEKCMQGNISFYKSYIPCTKEYETRADYAEALEEARNTIRVLKK